MDRTLEDLEARIDVLEGALNEILRTKVNCKSGHHMQNVARNAMNRVIEETNLPAVPHYGEADAEPLREEESDLAEEDC